MELLKFFALQCAAAAALALPAAAAVAQVTYFDTPPSVEQLQEALRKPATPDSAPANRPARIQGRGIEWQDSADAPASPPAQKRQEQEMNGQTREFGRPGTASSGASGVASNGASGGPAQDGAPAIAVPVNFDLGSAQINKASMQYIDAIAGLLLREPNLQLLVEGHTDASGDPQRNMMLSWERAFTVFKTLVQRYGIDPGRLQPVGKGSTEPMQGKAPTEGVNRRVQFRVLG
ncbi:MAG TPA: OmpA family protein [Noviherbaspirillum sp.]|uniref:OmpA family protein n=1 Tax=Noviherbaspirillum sp. TaxID=1926288 RepID=UPI002D5CF6B7|nr:OmpA family protein [Noviherbaspirillum sp.]HYD97512.1 OmpA family protein [Noviherbaspirillum sp.]